MKVYTKTGDEGTTSLVGGKRVEKFHPRLEAYGTVDELMAHTAYLKDCLACEAVPDEYGNDILVILEHLMRISAIIAAEDGVTKKLPPIEEPHVSFLEKRIDAMQAALQPVTKLTLPGGHPLVSLAHICRTVCRRAERRAVEVSSKWPVNENVMQYLNRLSDYFYVLGRKLSDELGVKEIYWLDDN